MRTLEPQENDETKLVAVFDIENFTAPIGRVSECFMKLEVIDDDYKRFLKNPPTWHSNESILPDEITVPDILRDANYKAMLQIHITFDNENVSSLTGKPSEIIYKCPGEVSIKLIQKVFDYTRNNTIRADKWTCGNGSEIAAIELCDGKDNCGNDESPEICEPPNQDQVKFIGIPMVIGFFCLGCFIYFNRKLFIHLLYNYDYTQLNYFRYH